MHRVIHNSCRLFLAATAFTMVFLLTPRVWVDGGTESTSRTIPVDRLEQSDTCLWCDQDRPTHPEECSERDDDQLWLNPDDPQPHGAPESCDDADDEPNA